MPGSSVIRRRTSPFTGRIWSFSGMDYGAPRPKTNMALKVVVAVSLTVLCMIMLQHSSHTVSTTHHELSGKNIGIIGLGHIGLAIAKRAEAFGCNIAYHSRSKKSDSTYTYYSSVMDLAASSDVLVVACPLTRETRHIIDRSVLDALGPKAILVNIGRGPLVDEKELVKALVEARLGGAGLDVFENEPDVPNELFDMDNVVLLPHVGSATWETRKEMADLVIGNLEAYFSKKPLLTPVE